MAGWRSAMRQVKKVATRTAIGTILHNAGDCKISVIGDLPFEALQLIDKCYRCVQNWSLQHWANPIERSSTCVKIIMLSTVVSPTSSNPAQAEKNGKVSKASSKPSSSSSAVSIELTPSQLLIIVQNDQEKYLAAVKIRRWVKRAMINRKKLAISRQLSEILQQHTLMTTNPQHFRDTNVKDFMTFSPIYTTDESKSLEPFRLIVETTDALLIAERNKYMKIAAAETNKKKKSEMVAGLKALEGQRQDILQLYARRATFLANSERSDSKQTEPAKPKHTVAIAPKEAAIISTENEQNVQSTKKKKKSKSLCWADSKPGVPLFDQKPFQSDSQVISNV